MVFYSRYVYLYKIRVTPHKKIKHKLFSLIACMNITCVTKMFQYKEFRRMENFREMENGFVTFKIVDGKKNQENEPVIFPCYTAKFFTKYVHI